MKIEVYQDTVCPWCRIGKRNLILALKQWQAEPVEVTYRSFFLNPNIPAEGFPFHEYMHAKGGGQVPLEDFFDAPRRMGAQVGLNFAFERIERAPNSLLSHRLIYLAPAEKKEAILDAVYAAYFEFGQDIGDLEVLLGIAGEHGLDVDQLRQQLADDAGREEVLVEARRARLFGVSGVPYFIVDDRYAFSGAQPPEAIVDILNQITEKQHA